MQQKLLKLQMAGFNMQEQVLMERKLKNYIHQFDGVCNYLNFGLNSFFLLEERKELIEYVSFEKPIFAAKKKIIPREGDFYLGNQPIMYNFHGTGVTLNFKEVEVHFEYFPKVKIRTPILGINKLINFISSVNKNESLQSNYENMKVLIDNLCIDNFIVKTNKNFYSFYVNKNPILL